MTADEAAVAVVDALDRAGIPFMIVGSIASNFHGIPRSTRDANFVRWATLANRGKDRDHVRNMIAVRGDELDWDYIRKWCVEHGTLALLDEIRQSIPPA